MEPKILEAVDALSGKLDKQALENKAAVDVRFAEAQRLIAENDTKWEAKVQELNAELSKKGATLAEIQTQVEDMRKARGRFSAGEGQLEKKAAVIISEAMEEHFKEITSVTKGKSFRFETKAVGTMTAANNLAGNVVATYDLTPQVRGRRRINIRDLVPVINSSTGVWKFYRQRTPIGEGSIGFQGGAGNTKSQLDYDLDEITVNTDYLAGWALIAKQMLADLPFLQNFVSNEMIEDYKRAESTAFFAKLAGEATGDTTVESGGAPLAEKYIDWIANLMSNDFYANAIITTARNWGRILKTKPNDYDVPGGIQIAPDGTVLFMGIPLIAQNNIATDHTLIGDFSKAAIIQQEGLSVEFFEQDSDNVRRNLITGRVEARVGWATLRPDAFIYAAN